MDSGDGQTSSAYPTLASERGMLSLDQLLSGLSVLALGAFGWIALEFIGRPIRLFLDLRREIRRQMFFLANVAVPIEYSVDYLNELKRMEDAQKVLRDLGAQAMALGESESLASTVLKILGFDSFAAGSSLIGLSNSLPKYGVERAEHRKAVETALRLHKMQ